MAKFATSQKYLFNNGQQYLHIHKLILLRERTLHWCVHLLQLWTLCIGRKTNCKRTDTVCTARGVGLADTTLYGVECRDNYVYAVIIKNVGNDDNNSKWACQWRHESDFSLETTIFVQVGITSVTITQPVTDQVLVITGKSVQFACETNGGRPAATIRWYSNSGTDNPTDNTEITGDAPSTEPSNGLIVTKGSVTVSVDSNDEGVRIYCTARNTDTTVYSSLQPALHILYPPVTPSFKIGETLVSNVLKMVHGTSLTLSCISASEPLPSSYTWSYPEGTYSGWQIPINSVDTSRSGQHTCRIQNTMTQSDGLVENGDSSASITVTVLYPPTVPYFSIANVNVSSPVWIIRGNDKTISCISSSEPAPNLYSWTHPAGTYTGFQLPITNFQSNKVGKYTCSVTNTMDPTIGNNITGANSAFIDVTELFPPSPPQFFSGLGNNQLIPNAHLDVIEHDTIDIKCLLEASPEPDYSWKSHATASQILTMTSINRDTTSKTCYAKNTMVETSGPTLVRTATGTLTINVMYPPSSPSFVVNSITVESPGPVEVNESANLKLTCVSSGNPMPLYMWILPDGTTRIGQHLEVISIQISGNYINLYTCTAHNTMIPSDGAAITGSKSSALIVVYLHSPRPSRNEPLVTNISVVLDTSVTLSFTAAAYPIPESSGFVWHKCNEGVCAMLLSGDSAIITSIGLMTNLTIHDVNDNDLGIYTLVISNGIGKAFEQDYIITLQDRPNIPTQFDYLDDSITTSSVTLVWNPSFNGGLPQTFVIQYKPVSNHDEWISVNVAEESEGIMHFTLTSLQSDTGYVSRMFAYNTVNQSDVTAQIEFKTKPVDTITEDTHVSHSSTLIGGIVGGCVGLAVIVTVVVVVLFIRKRRLGLRKNSSNESEATTYTELNVTASASNVYDPIQTGYFLKQTETRNESSSASTNTGLTQYDNTQNSYELDNTGNEGHSNSKEYANV